MNSFTVKGVCFGSGRPKTIVSLMDACEEALVTCAKRVVATGVDCLEWRADFASDLGKAAVAHTGRTLMEVLPATPLVFTFRSAGQGGTRAIEPDVYTKLVHTVIEAQAADIVDVELGIGTDAVRELVTLAHAHGMRAIVSHHDFAGTPSVAAMEELIAQMAELGADLPKLAVMAHDVIDCLHLMEATARMRERLGKPLVTMAMGGAGTLSRLAGEATGSALTFCALDAPSAPGQVGLAQATAAMERLHAAMAPAADACEDLSRSGEERS